tara:strand:+ start:395 stop:1852 length:1458 start_codon:yes stop_codon:yes gene_type:complete
MNFLLKFFKKRKQKNIDPQGQILENTKFATSIGAVINKYKPEYILEIGTWKGLGSTKVILDSIIKANYDPDFISLESNLNFYNAAKENLNHYKNKVKLVYGRIIELEIYSKYVTQLNLSDEHKLWMKDDLKNYNECPNVSKLLPNEIDFLLLDGGEFSTYLEWEMLKDRSKIVALDDTKVEKTKKIMNELIADSNYESLYKSDERNGFHIFFKKNISSKDLNVKKKDIIQLNKFANLHNGKDIIFCKTDFLDSLFEKLKDQTNDITLITGNSDYGINESLVSKKPNCIKKWYAQNVEYSTSFIEGIPIGIENHEMCKVEGHGQGWPHAAEKINLLVKNSVKKIKIKPSKKIYCNFSIETHHSRKKVLDICKQSEHITVETYESHEKMKELSYSKYIENILDHEMIICPRGNGIDCHRIWESLYLGRVPVVEKSLTTSFFNSLPILFVDDWNELLDIDLMNKKYDKVKNNSLELLDFNYWKNKIIK